MTQYDDRVNCKNKSFEEFIKSKEITVKEIRVTGEKKIVNWMTDKLVHCFD